MSEKRLTPVQAEIKRQKQLWQSAYKSVPKRNADKKAKKLGHIIPFEAGHPGIGN